jgi:hypothetical protein
LNGHFLVMLARSDQSQRLLHPQLEDILEVFENEVTLCFANCSENFQDLLSVDPLSFLELFRMPKGPGS